MAAAADAGGKMGRKRRTSERASEAALSGWLGRIDGGDGARPRGWGGSDGRELRRRPCAGS